MSKDSEEAYEHFLKRGEAAAAMHRHYRGAGVAFSVSLASICGALLTWTVSLAKFGWNLRVSCQLALLALTILACLALQFFNYWGYREEAQAFFDPDRGGKNNVWFSREDRAVIWAVGLFFAALVLCSISLFKST